MDEEFVSREEFDRVTSGLLAHTRALTALTGILAHVLVKTGTIEAASLTDALEQAKELVPEADAAFSNKVTDLVVTIAKSS